MRIAPILAVVVLVAGTAGGYAYWVQEQALRVPPGLARANGRIEVERIDVATKYAGRIAELRVDKHPQPVSSGRQNERRCRGFGPV